MSGRSAAVAEMDGWLREKAKRAPTLRRSASGRAAGRSAAAAGGNARSRVVDGGTGGFDGGISISGEISAQGKGKDRCVEVNGCRVLLPEADPVVEGWHSQVQVTAAESLFRQRSGDEPRFHAAFVWGNRVPRVVTGGAPQTEVAFYGSSNSGKSSLVNAVLGGRLAHTSEVRGSTQQLKLFSAACGPRVAVVVDMPGYGHLEGPPALRHKLKAMCARYLSSQAMSGALKTVFILIDIRRGVSPQDATFMKQVRDLGLEYQVIITKADTVEDKKERLASVRSICFALPGGHDEHRAPEVLVVSAQKRWGISALRTSLMSRVGALGLITNMESEIRGG